MVVGRLENSADMRGGRLLESRSEARCTQVNRSESNLVMRDGRYGSNCCSHRSRRVGV